MKSLLVAIASLLTILPPARDVPAQVPFYTPLSVRGYSMGEAGSADAYDFANAALNPGIAFVLKGAHASLVYSKHSFPYSPILGRSTDATRSGFVVGGGYHVKLNELITIGAGVGLGYAKFLFELRDAFSTITSEFEYTSPYYIFSLGMGYRDLAHMGIGATIKEFTALDYAPTGTQEKKTNLYDCGLFAKADILRRGGYVVTAAIGFTYMNIGDPIELHFITRSTAKAPEFRRYGISARFESPAWEKANRYFNAEPPAASFVVDFDIDDDVRMGGDKKKYIGAELGVLQILFLRIGYIDLEEVYYRWQKDPTYGFGIGYSARRFSARFDYARSPLYSTESDMNMYGVTLEWNL